MPIGFVLTVKKGRTYSKPITKEIQNLVQASIEYTKQEYGVEEYIFVSKKNPEKSMTYATMTYHLRKSIRELNLRDDQGNLFTPKTHILDIVMELNLRSCIYRMKQLLSC